MLRSAVVTPLEDNIDGWITPRSICDQQSAAPIDVGTPRGRKRATKQPEPHSDRQAFSIGLSEETEDETRTAYREDSRY
jgi:hypothetical protein